MTDARSLFDHHKLFIVGVNMFIDNFVNYNPADINPQGVKADIIRAQYDMTTNPDYGILNHYNNDFIEALNNFINNQSLVGGHSIFDLCDVAKRAVRHIVMFDIYSLMYKESYNKEFTQSDILSLTPLHGNSDLLNCEFDYDSMKLALDKWTQ